MKHAFLAPLSCCCFLLFANTVTAQPIVDIGLFNDGNGMLEVRLRPDGPFDELVSAISFTIRWNDADGATLGAVSQVMPEALYCPTTKSGPMHVFNGYRYQIFAGFSVTTLADAETAWLGGEEVILIRVPVIGGSTFAIINDDWTADVNNNGNFYISLNGEPSTGSIYSISTGMAGVTTRAPEVSLLPNPTDRVAQLTVTVLEPSDLSLELFDPTGRAIMNTTHPAVTGTYRQALDVETFADGVYFLKLKVGGVALTRRLVVDHD